jgi:hypothetical protein
MTAPIRSAASAHAPEAQHGDRFPPPACIRAGAPDQKPGIATKAAAAQARRWTEPGA